MSELDGIRKRTEGHTPGKWTVEAHGMADALYSGRDDQHHGLNLCTLSNWDMNGAADARLIAAAPDLLRIATEMEAELREAVKLLDEIMPDYAGVNLVTADIRRRALTFLARHKEANNE
jgi:hypothetical protein